MLGLLGALPGVQRSDGAPAEHGRVLSALTDDPPLPTEHWVLEDSSKDVRACSAGRRGAAEEECLAAVREAASREGQEVAGFKSVNDGATGVVPAGCSYSLHSKTAMFNANAAGGSAGVGSYRLACLAAPDEAPTRAAAPDSSSVTARINDRFRTGRPSNNLTEVGLLFRQFDGLEVHERPWEACEQDCHLPWSSKRFLALRGRESKSELFGRLSATIAYQGLRDRPDRKAISLIYPDRAGYVLRNEEVSLQCLYGKDAATFFVDSSANPGCVEEYCDENHWQYFSGMPCGFSAPGKRWIAEDYHPPAYRPADMQLFLERYAEHGELWRPPGFYSGYNEVIVSSVDMNRQLPRAIEAFFVLNEADADVDTSGTMGSYGNVRKVRKAFIAKYSLKPSEVPLLLMDPWNWDAPFTVLDDS